MRKIGAFIWYQKLHPFRSMTPKVIIITTFNQKYYQRVDIQCAIPWVWRTVYPCDAYTEKQITYQLKKSKLISSVPWYHQYPSRWKSIVYLFILCMRIYYLLQIYKAIYRLLQAYKDERKGPTFIAVQSPMCKYNIQGAQPSKKSWKLFWSNHFKKKTWNVTKCLPSFHSWYLFSQPGPDPQHLHLRGLPIGSYARNR